LLNFILFFITVKKTRKITGFHAYQDDVLIGDMIIMVSILTVEGGFITGPTVPNSAKLTEPALTGFGGVLVVAL
jgi:hypothetical protein